MPLAPRAVTLFWLSLSTFGVCLASGFIPVVNSEVYLLAASAASPGYATVPLVVAGTLGAMTAKLVLYFGARGVLRVPVGRSGMRERIGAAAARLERWRGHMNSMVFVGAAVGLPPFMAVSVFCGMTRYPAWRFVVLGTVGLGLRFAAIVYTPELLKGWLL